MCSCGEETTSGQYRKHIAAMAAANLPEDMSKLLRFLEAPLTAQAPVWKRLFGAVPPRKVFARAHARTAEALQESDSHIHVSLQCFNYKTFKDLRREFLRFRQWYGRRGQKPTIFSDKPKTHYTRLLKKSAVRMRGFWQSRKVSLLMQSCQLSSQTGTVPTERMWSNLQAYFPAQMRRISVPYFNVLNHYGFLRFNLRHAGKLAAQQWCDDDCLLAEKFENFKDSWRREAAGESPLPPDLVQDLLGVFPEV